MMSSGQIIPWNYPMMSELDFVSFVASDGLTLDPSPVLAWKIAPALAGTSSYPSPSLSIVLTLKVLSWMHHRPQALGTDSPLRPRAL